MEVNVQYVTCTWKRHVSTMVASPATPAELSSEEQLRERSYPSVNFKENAGLIIKRENLVHLVDTIDAFGNLLIKL